MLAVVVLALSSASPSGIYDSIDRAGADMLVPIPDENRMGRAIDAEVMKHVRLHGSDVLQRYVAKVGAHVAKTARDTPAGIQLRFRVIDDDNANAFALPGGAIYITSGMISLLHDEAELASMLAIEIAHVTQRIVVVRLLHDYGITAITDLAAGGRPELARQIGINVVETGAVSRFTHVDEGNVDGHALTYVTAAHLDPNALVRVLEALLAAPDERTTTYLRNQPVSTFRIHQVRALIHELKVIMTSRNQLEFEQVIGPALAK